MKNKLFNISGFIWCLPVSIIVWMFGLILLFFNQIKSIHTFNTLVFVWNVNENGFFYKKFGEGWFGWTLGNNIFLYIDYERSINSESFIHELTHIKQNYQWGIFFLLAYLINMLYIHLFKKDKHFYLDNYFELKANKEAEKLYKGKKL